MPIHEFKSDVSTPRVPEPVGRVLEDIPSFSRRDQMLPLDMPPAHYGSEVINDDIIKGYEALDEAMKNYFSDIRVPTMDGYRFLGIKLAGGDRSLQVWRNTLSNGRTLLPVAAIDRISEQPNPDKYSPPILPMTVRYLNKSRTRAAKVFRPAASLVEYTLLVWTEHKTDIEYIHYQIFTRFNGCGFAELSLFDGKLRGNVQLRYGGMTDSTDKESTGQDQHNYRRYEYRITAEGWLPLPEVHMNTILGRVTTVREASGGVAFVTKSGIE